MQNLHVTCKVCNQMQTLFVACHGQYNVHERALTQVVTAVLAESFGQSEIYLARPVMDSFEQARMHTVPTM